MIRFLLTIIVFLFVNLLVSAQIAQVEKQDSAIVEQNDTVNIVKEESIKQDSAVIEQNDTVNIVKEELLKQDSVVVEQKDTANIGDIELLEQDSTGVAHTDTVNIVKEELPEKEATDIIYQHDGKKMLVEIKKIYLNDIYYSFPGQTKVNKIDQRLIHKVEYKSGKVQVINEDEPGSNKTGDYRKVKVTKDEADVDGLIEVAKLKAVAEGSDNEYSTAKTLERTATIVLRRKAALVNADIVLITKRKSQVAFGEQPVVTLYGTAYTYR